MIIVIVSVIFSPNFLFSRLTNERMESSPFLSCVIGWGGGYTFVTQVIGS